MVLYRKAPAGRARDVLDVVRRAVKRKNLFPTPAQIAASMGYSNGSISYVRQLLDQLVRDGHVCRRIDQQRVYHYSLPGCDGAEWRSRSRRRWSPADVTDLRDMWQDHTLEELAGEMNRSSAAIALKAKEMGLCRAFT